MAAVAALPCLVCGRYGVEVHHQGKPRNDMRVLPLCAPHHRREFGPGAYHYAPKAFHAEHFDIACRRVDEAARQPDLFIAPAAKPVQDNLFGGDK
jgi:hypothetical protein